MDALLGAIARRLTRPAFFPIQTRLCGSDSMMLLSHVMQLVRTIYFWIVTALLQLRFAALIVML